MGRTEFIAAATILLSLAGCEEPGRDQGPRGLGDAGDVEEVLDTDDGFETDDGAESSGGSTGEIGDSEQARRLSVSPRVRVLSFDPLINGTRLHQHYGWGDPRKMTNDYRDAVRDATSGSVNYDIEEFGIIEDFPLRVDGQQWTGATYTECRDQGTSCLKDSAYESDIAAYASGFDWCADAEAGVDELWIFGAPGFGMPESQMMGKGSHWLNSTPLTVECDTPLVIMIFSYERGVAEMLHNLGHRIESHMGHIFSSWPGGVDESPWSQFSRQGSSGDAECGTVHRPPNALSEYDYANATDVTSGCSRWNNYPDHEFPSFETISCNTWSCSGDPQFGYMSWWISRLPNREGLDAEGFQTDWRRYVFNYRTYL